MLYKTAPDLFFVPETVVQRVAEHREVIEQPQDPSRLREFRRKLEQRRF